MVSSEQDKVLIFKVMDYKIPDVKISKRNKEVFANCKISVGDKKLAFREEKTLMVATV